jgi:putative hemolysin
MPQRAIAIQRDSPPLLPGAASTWPRGILERLLERLVALTAIGRGYQAAVAGDPAVPFCTRALRQLDLSLDVEPAEVGRIPGTGPLVVVANHPSGAIDGLALLDVVGRARADVKVLANCMLRALPPLRSEVLAIDLFGGRAARARNVSALRQASAWLAAGHCLCVFPAGEVAHEPAPGRMVDSPWHDTAAELAVRWGASVLPIHFDGGNSSLFRLAGRVHPLLRTILLPREMWARRGATVGVRIGNAVSADVVARESPKQGRTALLRARVEALANDPRPMPVADRGLAAAIEADIAALDDAALLHSGAFTVYCASASRLPAVLPEIGRLRELTFRGAGEGTGQARDLDGFDVHYLHLFVWDHERRAVAGAYRICPTDTLGRRGVKGLYTRTLFEYDQALLDRLGPALELGRSFVTPAYQRDYSPLLLLWKGIGRVVTASGGRYRRLFGAVSISDRYASATRELLVAFLQATRQDRSLAELVRARRPLSPVGAVAPDLTRMRPGDVSAAIRRLEADGKDMPVLLRQYLRLNAKLLSFSVDPAFGDALDGLMVVDLAEVEPALLARVLGRDQVSLAFPNTSAR